MPIFWQWNRKIYLGTFITGENSTLKRNFSGNGNWNNFYPFYDSHSVFLNMSETSCHLLRLGTWNLIDVFRSSYWVMLGFWRIALFKDLAKTLLHQVCVIFKRFISNCTILQQTLCELISLSIILPIFFDIQLTIGGYLLQQESSSYLRIQEVCPSFLNHRQTLQQNYRTWYKQIRWPHSSNILDVIFYGIYAAYFWLHNFNKKLIKKETCFEIFVKEQCFEKKCFDNKKCKECSPVKDQPIFLHMNKSICHLGRLRTWNLMDGICTD